MVADCRSINNNSSSNITISKSKSKPDIAVCNRNYHTATGNDMPYEITQCYLPPGRGDFPAFTPAEAGTRFSDPGVVLCYMFV